MFSSSRRSAAVNEELVDHPEAVAECGHIKRMVETETGNVWLQQCGVHIFTQFGTDKCQR